MYMPSEGFEELKKDILYQLVNQPPQLSSVTIISIVPVDRENDYIDYAKRIADRLNVGVSFIPKRYQLDESVIEAKFDWKKEDKFDKELKKQEELSLINNIVEQAIYHGGDIGGPYFCNGDGLCEAMEKYLVYKGFDKDTEVFYHTKGIDHNFVEFKKKEKEEEAQ